MAIIQNLLQAYIDIFKPIFVNPSLIWYIAPIIIFWFVLEIYFSLHKSQELGWNTVLGNGLSLFWVSLAAIKFLFDEGNFSWIKLIVLLLMLICAFFLILDSFSKRAMKNIAFLLASPTTIYFLSGVAVIWTYGDLEITWWVLLALMLFYLLILLVTFLLKRLIKGKTEYVDMTNAPKKPWKG